MSEPMKQCSKCGERKGLGEFFKKKGARDGRRSECKTCRREQQKVWREENREKVRERNKAYYAENRDKLREYQKAHYKENRESQKAYHLRRRYGLTPEERADMVEAQGGRCAICGDGDKPLCVDHCHASGNVRGLLCRQCNSGIGLLRDNPDLALAAYHYLQDPPACH